MANDQADLAAHFEFVFHHTATGILLVDPDGVLVRFNPAAASLLALGSAARGQPLGAVFDDQPHLLRALTSPETDAGPVTLANRRQVRVVSSNPAGCERMILVEDVTGQQAIDSGRAALVRQIAHDLRNPIHALSGFADLAATEPGASPEQIEYLERVQRIADKLYNLAGTLVELAWIESGMPLEQTPVRLDEVIRAAIAALADEAQRRASTVELELPGDLPPVLGDAARLQQALDAVLRNALFYAPDGAPVTIRASRSSGEVCCEVVDRGFGIAPDDLPKVFDRLWRSDDPRVLAVPGGGIGLTLAQAIVLRHGGRIAIASTPGAGTTVTLALPAAESW